MKIISAVDILQGYINSTLEKLPDIAIALIIILLFYILSKIAQRLGGRVADRATHDLSLRSLFRTMIQVLVMGIGIFVAAAVIFPGLKAGDLIGVLGLSSVAIGFAFKDIFQNFLAGILILTQRPFTITDQIARGDIEGTVEHINIRSTIIKTYDGQRIVVPNSELFTNAVTVRTAYPKRRTTFKAGIAYGEDIEQARAAIRKAIESCENVEQDPVPQIYVTEHADSAIVFDIRYWTDTKKAVVMVALDEVATAIKYALDDAGIEIPFPYRTVEFFDKTNYAEIFEQLTDEQIELLKTMRQRGGQQEAPGERSQEGPTDSSE